MKKASTQPKSTKQASGKTAKATEASTEKKAQKIMRGVVVSDSGDKTIVAEIVTYKEHTKYRKKYKSTKRYKINDESGKHVKGEIVEFIACRPMSKGKNFKVVE